MPFRLVLCAVLAVAFGPMRFAQAQSGKPTIILVHGAFADGASWDKVIPLLEAKGHKVVAVHLPLSSLADDVGVTRRAIGSQNGPIVLVGHSWGGMVISMAGTDAKVKSLVYVSAFMPSEGESASDLLKPYAPSPGTAHLIAMRPASSLFRPPTSRITSHQTSLSPSRTSWLRRRPPFEAPTSLSLLQAQLGKASLAG
jgi:pimeloyl-ACP methyl ester carboxylesterase